MFEFHEKKKILDLISAYDSLLSENVSVLKKIVMSDEKWTIYNNMEWKRFQSKWNTQPLTTSKSGDHVLPPVKLSDDSTQWKASRISQWKSSSIRIMQDRMLHWWTGKNYV